MYERIALPEEVLVFPSHTRLYEMESISSLKSELQMLKSLLLVIDFKILVIKLNICDYNSGLYSSNNENIAKLRLKMLRNYAENVKYINDIRAEDLYVHSSIRRLFRPELELVSNFICSIRNGINIYRIKVRDLFSVLYVLNLKMYNLAVEYNSPPRLEILASSACPIRYKKTRVYKTLSKYCNLHEE